MHRSLLALILLLVPQAAAQMDLRVDLEPLTAEIGEPVSLILTAEHVPAFIVELPDDVLPDDSWLLIDGPDTLTLPHPKRGGLVITVVRWEIASLDSGERTFEFPAVRWSDGNSAGLGEETALTLKVGASLAEGEDAPRAARMFREPVLPDARISRWPWVLAGALLFLVVVYLFKRERRTSAKQGEDDSPLSLLDTLEARSGELGIRGTYFELSALVRSALDEGGENHVGLTDEEWLAAREQDARSSEAECESLKVLFSRCQEVKYAQAEPTRWALDETLASAKQLAHAAVSEQPEVAA